MKNKLIQYFWIGFSLSAIVAALIYWFLRNKREILPETIIVKKETPKLISKDRVYDKEVVPDDLSKIRGVGPTYTQKLNEAGIFTFEQLSQTSPENIRQVTGDTRWDPEQWIVQASELSGKSKTN